MEPYPDVVSLPGRFLRHGFTTSHAITLRDIRRSCISKSELERYGSSISLRDGVAESAHRISQLEMLDEVEELDLVLEHYAVTWGVKLNDTDAQAVWKGWGFKPA